MAATVTALSTRRRRRLGPEPWGAKLARARETTGMTQRQVAMMLRGLHGYSYGTIQRLEKLEEAPALDDATHRGRAFVLLVIYGYEPDQFDLNDGDCPPFLDPLALADMASDWGPDLGTEVSRCSVLSLVAAA